MARLATRFELGNLFPGIEFWQVTEVESKPLFDFEPRRPLETNVLDPLHKNSRGNRI
jgi:hypothetical protein